MWPSMLVRFSNTAVYFKYHDKQTQNNHNLTGSIPHLSSPASAEREEVQNRTGYTSSHTKFAQWPHTHAKGKRRLLSAEQYVPLEKKEKTKIHQRKSNNDHGGQFYFFRCYRVECMQRLQATAKTTQPYTFNSTSQQHIKYRKTYTVKTESTYKE